MPALRVPGDRPGTVVIEEGLIGLSCAILHLSAPALEPA
jgi:hypothetical protein